MIWWSHSSVEEKPASVMEGMSPATATGANPWTDANNYLLQIIRIEMQSRPAVSRQAKETAIGDHRYTEKYTVRQVLNDQSITPFL